MLEYQTPASIYATILMQEPQPVAVLLVEGPDDDSLLDDHLTQGVLGIVCGGKKNVIDTAFTANTEGRKNIFGLIDRDLSNTSGLATALPKNVVETKTYDLTADIADTKPLAIERVLMKLDHRATRAVREARGESVDDAVIDLVSRFAGARIAAETKGYEFRLRAFQFKNVLNSDFSTSGEDNFIRALTATQKDFSLDNEDREYIVNLMSSSIGNRDLCGGHDIASAACALISKAGASQVNRNTVEAGIRLLGDCSALITLNCIVKLQQMCLESTRHPMFGCFRGGADPCLVNNEIGTII